MSRGRRSAKGLRVGVVGATGMVGGELLRMLESRAFPAATLLPFNASGFPALFRGRRLPGLPVSRRALASCDLVFFVSSDEISLRYARRLAASGTWVIDDSSAFRLHPSVPLIIPEVNAAALSPRRRLIAGPNCTVTGAAVACRPILEAAGIAALRLASYQAVSGAGKDAVDEFARDCRGAGRLSLLRAPRLAAAKALPEPAAFNVFPQVGSFDSSGECSEEKKIRDEIRKLWSSPSLPVSATTVRVPVLRGHSLALWVRTRAELAPGRAKALLRRMPGLTVWEEGYPTPLRCALSEGVHVGRIRRSGAAPQELALWVVSDNLLKGAALNSVQIAELLLARGWLRPRGG